MALTLNKHSLGTVIVCIVVLVVGVIGVVLADSVLATEAFLPDDVLLDFLDGLFEAVLLDFSLIGFVSVG